MSDQTTMSQDQDVLDLQAALELDATEALRTRRATADEAQVQAWWGALHGRGRHGAAARQAREGLIAHFAPLVSQVAGRMIGRLPDTVELGDLVSSGMFGLIDAVERFEPERGFKFETYASTRVRGAIIDELRAADWVPRSVRAKARAVDEATRALEQELQRAVTDEDVCERLGWDAADVRSVRAQVSFAHVGALEAMANDNGEGPVPVTRGPREPSASEPLEERETRVLLAAALQGVRDRERQVLQMYYFDDLTLAQIGSVLGVTESRISQIHSAAVRKLRTVLLSTGAFG